MKVYSIKPFGFCQGVSRALAIAYQAKKENPNLKVYLLGLIVHNEDVVESLSRFGFSLLDERKDSLSHLLSSIPNGQVVVFSAHGHAGYLDSMAKEKNLKAYDATCDFVKSNTALGLSQKRKGSLIYIGVKGHLECLSFLENCPGAVFFDVLKKDFDEKGILVDDPLIISQTTLSSEEIDEANRKILSIFPRAVKGPERCYATNMRQEAIKSIPSSCGAVIILGSSHSNNSIKLYELAKARGFEAYLVLGLPQLRELDLSKKSQVALGSGASTSAESYLACLKYLESL